MALSVGMQPFSRWLTVFCRRVASSNATRVLIICAVFGGLICAATYAGTNHATSGGSIMFPGSGRLAGSSSSPLVGYAGLGSNDPVMRFSETRVGQVVFTGVASDNCRRSYFDNRTGAQLATEDIFCGRSADGDADGDNPERVLALQRLFKK